MMKNKKIALVFKLHRIKSINHNDITTVCVSVSVNESVSAFVAYEIRASQSQNRVKMS